VLRLLRDHRAAQATAMPALRRAVPQRARSQPSRAPCHCGDGCPLPFAVRVGGAAGGAGRALDAVPAGARPLPRRRGARPYRLDARPGGRSPLAMVEPLVEHCLCLERPRRLCFLLALIAFSCSAGCARRCSSRCGGVPVCAGGVPPLRRPRCAWLHGGRCAGRAMACMLLLGVPTTKGALCWRAAAVRRTVWPSGRAGARGARVRAVSGGVPERLRGVGGAG